jgi:hypothetical protein
MVTKALSKSSGKKRGKKPARASGKKAGEKKSHAKSLRVRTGAVVLAVDANFDPVTKAPFEYREQCVYPYFEKKGFKIIRLQGSSARRTKVAPQARKANVVYLTGVGHGFPNSYTGDNLDPIFSKGGPHFVTKGCKAYFGYSDEFTYPPILAEIFFECDSEIDKGFADGLTADEVFKRVLARFQQHIDRLKSTGDGGDLFNASVLEVDLRLLRAPASGPEYGDPLARLGQA